MQGTSRSCHHRCRHTICVQSNSSVVQCSAMQPQGDCIENARSLPEACCYIAGSAAATGACCSFSQCQQCHCSRLPLLLPLLLHMLAAAAASLQVKLQTKPAASSGLECSKVAREEAVLKGLKGGAGMSVAPAQLLPGIQQLCWTRWLCAGCASLQHSLALSQQLLAALRVQLAAVFCQVCGDGGKSQQHLERGRHKAVQEV